VDISYLAGGIWEALLTTIGGLIIGIYAIIVYNDLVQQVADTAKLLQEKTDDFILRLYHKA